MTNVLFHLRAHSTPTLHPRLREIGEALHGLSPEDARAVSAALTDYADANQSLMDYVRARYLREH